LSTEYISLTSKETMAAPVKEMEGIPNVDSHHINPAYENLEA
jgi:hypothetical protein